MKYTACSREAAPHVRLSVTYIPDIYLCIYTCLHYACALIRHIIH